MSSDGQRNPLRRAGIQLAGRGRSLTGCTLSFGLVGLLASAADLSLFNVLLAADIGVQESSLLSFLSATILGYTLGARWAIVNIGSSAHPPTWTRYPQVLVVGLLALILRGAVLELFLHSAGWSARWAIIPAIATATIVSVAGSALFVFPRTDGHTAPAVRLREFALAIAACSLVLRLVFSGATDLTPEEAYYWNYAQHLDIGYLDHPPMVAWMIALSTGLFGDSEFAVRLPAILCWLAVAYFMYRWTKELFGKTSACLVLMLLAIFPFYFLTGFLMTPDAPLCAAWAGCLWYLTQALLGAHRSAWLGVGVCAGLGMLSKYTIALLGPAALVFIILDARSRQWLSRREPYLAILIATLLFSPVLVWNTSYEWVSLLYQGPDRWSANIDFSLDVLILSALVLVTPFGLTGTVLTWLPQRMTGLIQSNNVTSADRLWLFTGVFTLAPLSVFVLYSLQDNPKILWTGPVWLAVLPILASAIDSQRAINVRWISRIFSQKLWKPVATVMLLLLGGALYAITVGPPLVPKLDRMGLPVAWEEMMQAVEEIKNDLALETGTRPIVVGLSDYFISAEHAFYDPTDNGVEETGGRGLLGFKGWMWEYWQKPENYVGRNALMVTFEAQYLRRLRFWLCFNKTTDLRHVQIMKSGRVAGGFFYRIGYGYQLPPGHDPEKSQPRRGSGHGKILCHVPGPGASRN